jgi:hypothetical protein
MAKELKLFVVGHPSGDPADWSEYGHYALVMAESLAQALEMVDFASTGAEVRCEAPAVLFVTASATGADF